MKDSENAMELRAIAEAVEAKLWDEGFAPVLRRIADSLDRKPPSDEEAIWIDLTAHGKKEKV